MPFDYILRQNEIKMPREVLYMPESKIKLSQEKKRLPKEQLHKKFMKTSSDSEEEPDKQMQPPKTNINKL